MKSFLLFVSILLSTSSFSQFSIDGEIKNFSEQDILVRLFMGPQDKLINKVKSDKQGKFSVKIPENYSGLVRLTNSSGTSNIDILSNNEKIKFQADYSNNQFTNVTIQEGKTAEGFQQYEKFATFNDFKVNVFPMLKKQYNENDPFYKALIQEEQRIDAMSPITELPLLKYYVQVSDLASADVTEKNEAEIYRNKILNRLVSDNNYLEGTGFMPKLVLDYLRYSVMNANSQEEINSKIDSEIQILLDKTDLETPRGQNVLSSILLVLPQEQFESILSKYYDKATSLTCEITDDLKSKLTSHNSIVPGKQVPNIKFKNPVKGYQSLYDVKADKKIVIFWASWCPACQDEMPFVKEYYRNFKAAGGEIVSISLDFDEAAFKEATKDFEWVNYTELLHWDTPSTVDFGVQSTPTLFLLDKDNKLIKKGSHISDLVEL